MNTITKVSLEKVTGGFFLTVDNMKGMNEVVCFFSEGRIRSFYSLLREIGNNDLDTHINIEKIKKSTSNKNRLKYIKQFENKLIELNIL